MIEKKLKFEAEEQWNFRTIFGNRMLFKLVPGGFFDKLEQLEFKLEKVIGI